MTPSAVYHHYMETLWPLWAGRQDWTPNGAFHTPPTVPPDWAGWARIKVRYQREYDRADHRTHGPTFRPLWCAACTP